MKYYCGNFDATFSTSLPTGERGLKFSHDDPNVMGQMSLPTGERGLKFMGMIMNELFGGSLPTGERGLK